MSDIEAAIKSLLDEIDGYDTYMMYTVPEDIDPPMIAYEVERIADAAPLLSGNASGMESATVRINVYALSTSERLEMSDLVHIAIEGRDAYEDDDTVIHAIQVIETEKSTQQLDEGSEILVFIESFEIEVFFTSN